MQLYLNLLHYPFVATLIGICLCRSAGAVEKSYYIGERTSFDSDRQFSQSINSVVSFNDNIFASANLYFGLNPAVEPRAVDRNYGASATVGYNEGMWGLDASAGYGTTTTTRLETTSFGSGLTFSYAPGMFESAQHDLELLKAANRKIYNTEMKKPNDPLFWGRLGLGLTQFQNSAEFQQLLVSIEGNIPLGAEFVLTGQFFHYSYSKDPVAYGGSLEANATNRETILAARNLLGLPQLSLAVELAWQISNWDAFIPRVQTTKLVGFDSWEFTGQLFWRRRLTPKLSMGPSYETSIIGETIVSGLSLDFLYRI